MTPVQKEMVEEFQCPGCACGMDVSCFLPSEAVMDGTPNLACSRHSAGTLMVGLGCINLGMPIGFNRLGPINKERQSTNIRLFEKMPESLYNTFNVPVWAKEENGYLFLRTWSPRINTTYVDVIKGAKISDLPEPFSTTIINVTNTEMD